MGGFAAVVAGVSGIGADGLQQGDVPPMMPISKEATTTLQRLVGILRGEGGEMYAARAPEVGFLENEVLLHDPHLL